MDSAVKPNPISRKRTSSVTPLEEVEAPPVDEHIVEATAGKTDKNFDHKMTTPPVEKDDKARKTISNKAQLSDILLKSDMHGLPDLYDSFVHKKMCSVIIWLFVIIIALSLFSWQVFLSWVDFRDNPILTTYNLVNHKDGVPFPNVYICLNNPIHQGKLVNANVDRQWLRENLQNILSGSAVSGLGGVLGAKTGLASALVGVVEPKPNKGTASLWAPGGSRDPCDPIDEDGYPYFDPNCTTTTTTTPEPTITEPSPPWIPRDAEEFLMRVGHSVDELFEECSWQSVRINCTEYVEPVYDSNYGKCFGVLFDQTNQTVAGVGLSFVLNLNPSESLSFDRTAPTHYPVSLFDGVVIQVAPQGTSIMMAEAKTSVASGANSKLSLETTHMTLMDAESLDQFCIDEEEAAELLQVLRTQYSAALCKADCVAQQLLKTCNCVMPIDRRLLQKDKTDIEFCSKNVTNKCVVEHAQSQLYKDDVNACFEKCHITCSVWNLRLDTSSTPFPSPMFNEAAVDSYNIHNDLEKPNACGIPTCLEDQSWPMRSEWVETENGWEEQVFPDPYAEKQWFYNAQAGTCVQMKCWSDGYLSGSYDFEDHCLQVCDPCVGELAGDMTDYCVQSMIWSYDVTENTCKYIWHGYCSYTNNNFPDEQTCVDTCWNKNHTDKLPPTGTDDTLDSIGSVGDYVKKKYRDDTDQTVKNVQTKRSIGHIRTKRAYSESSSDIKLIERRRWLRAKYNWEDRVVVDVAYTHLQYVSITQSPSMTFSTFVGNIGGQFGLWLGASIISCAKIFIIIAPLIGNGIRACFRRGED